VSTTVITGYDFGGKPVPVWTGGTLGHNGQTACGSVLDSSGRHNSRLSLLRREAARRNWLRHIRYSARLIAFAPDGTIRQTNWPFCATKREKKRRRRWPASCWRRDRMLSRAVPKGHGWERVCAEVDASREEPGWLLTGGPGSLLTEKRRLKGPPHSVLPSRNRYRRSESCTCRDCNSATWAGKFLDQWCRQVVRSRIEPME